MQADQIFVIGDRVQFDGRGVAGTVTGFSGDEAMVEWDDGTRALAYPERLHVAGVDRIATRAGL